MNGPPIKRKPPGETGGGRKTTGSFGGQPQKKNTEDPRAFQGITNGRHADQKAPRWAEPPESDALRLLARLWGPK